MHSFPMSYVEPIDSGFAIPLIIILWVLLLILALAGLRRRKVRQDRARRLKIRMARRESYIQIAEEQEEAYIESLENKPKENPDVRHIRR